MTTPKHKKQFYIPGIISMTILPFIFISFANKKIQKKPPILTRVYFANKNFGRYFSAMTEKSDDAFPPKRKYIEINLSGNDKADQIKLDFAQIRVRKLLTQKDYDNGIHFRFGDSAGYWTFVKAICILHFEKAKTFAPIDNDLWFYQLPPDTTPTINATQLFHGGLVNDVVYYEPKISWWVKQKEQAIKILKSSWQMMLAFPIYIGLTIAFMRSKTNRRIT